MTKILLKIYDFFSGHRTIACLVLIAVISLCAFMISRVEYSEDISAFLPQNEESRKYSSVYERLGGSRIAVLFRFCGDSTCNDDYDDIRGRITEAMDRFGELWEETDTASVIPDMQVAVDDASILEVADFIRRNAPYLMTEGDYRRIDSLLALPGYIPDMMKKNRRMLMFPASSIVSENLRNDPLDFFSPLYIRMMSLNVSSSGEMFDSHIFIDGGKTGAVFFESPFGNSESGSNSNIAEMLDKVIGETEAEFGDVRISAAGGPIIAVDNARQIKKDSILAVVIA
ncbi:MAG: hypothetical protein K2G80_02050, partial [Bacteroidales bacterium]|nr:hypothetical protein [Bacteroidales bacterium]